MQQNHTESPSRYSSESIEKTSKEDREDKNMLEKLAQSPDNLDKTHEHATEHTNSPN